MQRSGPRASASRASAPASSGPPWAWWGLLAAALAGVGVSGYLAVSAWRGVPTVCLAGACAEVAASAYARFLGAPTAAWGLLLYVAVAALAAAGLRTRAPAGWVPLALLGLGVFGATFSAYLAWVQVAVLRAICSWCVASDALWLVLLALAVVLVRGWR